MPICSSWPKAATVPVINGLTRRAHPCQVMADVMTFEEHRGNIKGAKVAWVGDSNNVLASWVNAAELFECRADHRRARGLCPRKGPARRHPQGRRAVKPDRGSEEAVKGADLVITDTWVSMGDTDAAERRITS
jgi:ornithine carbamoyltransferase